MPAGGGKLSFWTSYDTEADWDHLFVEATTPGGDNWTTLPDANGHTTQAAGQSSCRGPGAGATLHPQLDHYQTLDGDATCTPTGTTGAWNAASGSSGGWQQWQIDLTAYAGQAGRDLNRLRQRLGDPGTRRVRRRHRRCPTGEGDVVRDAVSAAGRSPARRRAARRTPTTSLGSRPPASRRAPSVATDDTVYMGFGLEGITGADNRNAVMGRTMQYLLR